MYSKNQSTDKWEKIDNQDTKKGKSNKQEKIMGDIANGKIFKTH